MNKISYRSGGHRDPEGAPDASNARSTTVPLEYSENLNMSEIPGRSREKSGCFRRWSFSMRLQPQSTILRAPKLEAKSVPRSSRWPKTAVRQLAPSNTQRRQSSSAAEVPASGVFLRESTTFGGDPNTFFEPRLFLLRVAHPPMFLSFCSSCPQGDVAVGALLRARNMSQQSLSETSASVVTSMA